MELQAEAHSPTCMPAAVADALACASAVGKLHTRFAGGKAEVREVAHGATLGVTVVADRVALVVPLAGSAQGASSVGAARAPIVPGKMAVLIRPGTSPFVWPAAGRALLIQLTRQRLQAQLSARLGMAMRFAAADAVLDSGPDLAEACAGLAQALEGAVPAGPVREMRARGVETALIDALAGDERWRRLVTVNRAVEAAAAVLRHDPSGVLSAEALASAAGVTARTLREGFLACHGYSLAQFIVEVRLEHVRTRMASGRDSRPIQAVATAAGFATASSFTRAYVRKFGETPTMTRAQAVKQQKH